MKNWKKWMAMLLCAGMATGLAACGGGGGNDAGDAGDSGSDAAGDVTAITLWTYPIGSWGDSATVDSIVAAFNEQHPDISVSVEYLDYTSGDDQVTAAIEAGTAPDLIMEGPERLVTTWGAAGKMVDLSDLWDDEALSDISAVSEAVVNACKSSDGAYY